MRKDDLKQFCDRMQAAAQENLQSVVLYGSGAGTDFNEEYSDLNLLCVLRDAGATSLELVSEVIKWWTKSLEHRPPLIMTEEELRGSADVFAIETLDMKQQHRILAGEDVLSAIEIPMNLHRLQLERELRTMLLRLRQHFVIFAGDEENLKKALAKSVSSVVVMLRHVMITVGGAKTAVSKRDQVTAATAALKVDGGPVFAALDLREGRRVDGSVRQLYDGYMKVLSAVVERVDDAAPKREWQRVRG